MNGNCTTGTVVETTSFVSDGDGNLVKKIKPDGSKTLYVGGIYEVDKTSGGTVTGTKTYYPVAGAMRIGSTLYYVLKDQLGSASVVTDATANAVIVGEDRFYPFGGTRFTTGTMLTDKLFTGQREMAGLGIYNYGARFYSPKLGRFLSADTITLNPANPQKLNHFSYGANNPLRYTDPTGHRACDNVDEAGTCITEPGGGGSGFGGLHPKKPNKDKDNPSSGGGCVPSPGQWLCDLDSLTEDSSHNYTITNVVCPAAWNCTQEQMLYYLSLFAYPGQDPLDGPFEPGHPYSVDWPLTNISMGSLGAIQVSVTNGGWTTINKTLPSHILYNGEVDRTLSQDMNGNWIVTTHGFGTNTNPLLGVANQVAGAQIFEAEDINMTAYIYDQKFPNSNYITK
jgi:RHS repeat-associated protein